MAPRFTILAVLIAATAVSSVVPAIPALAGFNFRNQNGVAEGPADSRGTSPAVPAGEVSREELALPMPGENLSALQGAGAASKGGAPEFTPGMKTLKAPGQDNAPVVAAAPADTSGQMMVAGFGKELPLALAMEQIVPSGMVPAPAQDVDVSRTVSWEGGKPWQTVLNDAIAPLGLVSRVDGKQVRVEKKPGPPQFPSPDKPMEDIPAPLSIMPEDNIGNEAPPVIARQGLESEPLPMPGEMPGEMSAYNDMPAPRRSVAEGGADMLGVTRMRATDGMDTTPAPVAAPANMASVRLADVRNDLAITSSESTPAMRPAPRPAAQPAKTAPAESYEVAAAPVSQPVPQPVPRGPMTTPETYREPVPVAAAPSVPAAMPAEIERRDVWTALAGQDLRTVLTAWSSRVNVQLVWDTPNQYAVQDTISGTATYTDALSDLMEQYGSTATVAKPQAKLYAGNGEAAVLVIR